METITFELRDFPADVQDFLKQRAVTECKPIEEIIEAYIIETAELINQTSPAPTTD